MIHLVLLFDTVTHYNLSSYKKMEIIVLYGVTGFWATIIRQSSPVNSQPRSRERSFRVAVICIQEDSAWSKSVGNEQTS